MGTNVRLESFSFEAAIISLTDFRFVSNLDDGVNPVNYKVVYLGNPSWLYVYIKDLKTPALRVKLQFPISNALYLNSSTAYVGFSTANGNTTGITAAITNVTFASVPVNVTQSSVAFLNPALNSVVTAGSIGTLIFRPKDSCGNVVSSTGLASSVTLQLYANNGSSSSSRTISNQLSSGSVVPQGHGTFLVSFIIQTAGVYNFNVLYQGVAVKPKTLLPSATQSGNAGRKLQQLHSFAFYRYNNKPLCLFSKMYYCDLP